MKTLLLTKTSAWCRIVQDEMRRRYHDLTVIEGETGDPLPAQAQDWRGDLIISFVCPWILPAALVANTTAINYHPGPPEHPGFAPYSWALYHGDESYGVTKHEMVARVDAGRILAVQRFPIYQGDSVYRLQQRTMRHLVALCLAKEERFAVTTDVVWQRGPRTRADFERNLRRLIPYMPEREIVRRIHACQYPGRPGAMFDGEVAS